MLLTLQVLAVFLMAVAMSMALAHALEFPGKRRLDERTYFAVQAIYYPGFTLGGIGEPLAAFATLILLLVMRDRSAAFWWIFTAFIAVVAMHAVFWFVTQPTNRYWMKNQQLGATGAKFFSVDQAKAQGTDDGNPEWKRLRNRWEYSHIVRAALAVIGLIALTIAVAS